MYANLNSSTGTLLQKSSRKLQQAFKLIFKKTETDDEDNDVELQTDRKEEVDKENSKFNVNETYS